MRKPALVLSVLLVALSVAFMLLAWPALSWQQPEPQTIPPPASQETPPAQPAPPSQAPPAPAGPIIVLDPAHGGTDTGARGENGAEEKDIVLQIARTVREHLVRDGYRVLMTRSDDSNPSYDDRAALANSYRDVIFISLHVSSTGTPGAARAYYDQFSTPISPAPASGAATKPIVASGLTSWEQAQRSYVEVSHLLADAIQGALAQSFSGSPIVSTAAPVRALRSVAAPAAAIEISSVSGSTQESLAAGAVPLGAAIAHGIAALRQASASGIK